MNAFAAPIERLAAAAMVSDVEPIVRRWQHRLQLDHWTITVATTPPTIETDYGSIQRVHVYDVATLHLNASWPSWSRRDLDLVIVHELMHLHTAAIEFSAESVEGVLTHQARLLWHDRWDAALEGHVDRMATLLVDAWEKVDG